AKKSTYMGFEKWWLPPAPEVKKPRSLYNAASLAYLGDCIYELYARRHFFFPPLSINEYNKRVMDVVKCESQDLLLNKLLGEDFLTEEER
uniref:RNase III domain-containing protein n=8 Tax=Triticinae TaxID=1648030 RepID=A0A453E555_AEGTS